MNNADAHTQDSNGARNTARKGTILLMDDDKFLLDMYGMKFSGAGYAVQTCLSVKEALGILRGGFLPDVLLLDLTIPELDGFSFLKIISDEKLAPHALKIALTNQSADAEKAQATELGVTSYIVKASTIPSEVVDIVEAELAKHRT